MKILKLVLCFLACLAFLASSVFPFQKIDLTGTWIGKTEVPDSGTDEVTLVLKKTETGYTGIVNDSLAVIAKDTEVKEINLDGDKLFFAFPLADGARVVIKVTVAGDKLTGFWEHQEGDTGAIEMTRKK